MKRICSSPFFWLLVVPALLLALLGAIGGLQPRIEPDTPTYRDLDWSSWQTMLSNRRTLGYPLFLRAADLLGTADAAVPWLHAFALFAAGWIFYYGLRAIGVRPAVALAATLPLWISRNAFLLLPQATGDSLAMSLAIAACGCLFVALGQGTRVEPSSVGRAWIGLGGVGLFTFLAYQVRPAYLFTIPLWPGVALGLDWLIFRRTAPWADRWRNSLAVGLICALPFLGFCTVRWFAVGHWGLVSFGGYNIVGITGQFLDEELVKELPESTRPLGLAIVRRRAEIASYQANADFLAMEAVYNDIVWNVSLPAAQEVYGEDSVAINQGMTTLSREVIRRRPAKYARWLFSNAKHALKQMHFLLLLDPGSVVILCMLFAVHAWSLLRGGPAEKGPAEKGPAAAHAEIAGVSGPTGNGKCRWIERHALFWTAVAFAVGKTALVILVEPAIGRYMTGAILLIPSSMAIFLAHYLENVLGSPGKT